MFCLSSEADVTISLKRQAAQGGVGPQEESQEAEYDEQDVFDYAPVARDFLMPVDAHFDGGGEHEAEHGQGERAHQRYDNVQMWY